MDKPFDAAEIIRAVGIRLEESRQSIASEKDRIEREIGLQFKALVAEFRQQEAEREVTMLRMEQSLAERMARIKDGQDGLPGTNGAAGPPGVPGEAIQGPPGADGRSLNFRGTYKAEDSHLRDDVVMVDRGSFVALEDNPGGCPGPGWQLLAGGGKRGERGDKGERGERGSIGERGADGAAIVGGSFDARAMKLVLERSGGAPIEVDMYEFALAVKGA